MASIKAGKKIVSGQVNDWVSEYIQAFANARGCTKSVIVDEILSDWAATKPAKKKRDEIAHAEASEKVSDVGVDVPVPGAVRQRRRSA